MLLSLKTFLSFAWMCHGLKIEKGCRRGAAEAEIQWCRLQQQHIAGSAACTVFVEQQRPGGVSQGLHSIGSPMGKGHSQRVLYKDA